MAKCSTVDEVIQYLEQEKIALNNAHILLGDKNGKAVIVEWINGVKNIVYNYIAKNRYKWYGKKEACMLPTPEIKAKFL